MVTKPVDEESIKFILDNAKEDYNAFAIALGMERECEQLECRYRTSQGRLIALVQTWTTRDKEQATLHVLMKTLLQMSCKDGVDDLVQRYEEMLQNPCRLVN